MSFAKTIYLDTNVIVALIEGPRADSNGLNTFMDAVWSHGGVNVVTSELSFAELLVLPYRNRNTDNIDQYIRLFSDRDRLDLIPVGRPILDIAAVLRATSGRLKLPDAIHLATACASNCPHFLTFDRDFKDLIPMQHPLFQDILLPAVQVTHPNPASLSELFKALTP